MDAAHPRAAVRARHPSRGSATTPATTTPATTTPAARPRPARVRGRSRPPGRRRTDAALLVVAVLATIAGVAYLASDWSSDRPGRSTPRVVGAGAPAGSGESSTASESADPAVGAPAPEPPPERPVLGVGAAGPEVVGLQERLAALGFDPGRVDGRYGDGTGAAVRAFQVSVGLTADGVVGTDTWAALDAAAAIQPGP